MILHAHIKNGQIVLDDPAVLPEGAAVTVDIGAQAQPEPAGEEPSLYERLKPVIGLAKGLPSDLAAQHDHYLHGRAKQ